MEIRVTEINPSAVITIRTQFSDYLFRVTDPAQCRGVLKGGRLSVEEDAIFVETILPANSNPRPPARLEPGVRAVFLVGRNGLTKLITSIITEVGLYEVTETISDLCLDPETLELKL